MNEDEYRLLVDNLIDLVVKVDLDGRLLYVSPSYCLLFGKNESELLGQKPAPFVDDEMPDRTSAAMKMLFGPLRNCYVEQRAFTNKGWRWLGWAYKAVPDSGNKIVAIVGVGRDITDQKQVEEDLRMSQKRFRALFHENPSMFFTLDPDGTVASVNEYGAGRLGYTVHELEGQPVARVIHEADRAAVTQQLNVSVSNPWQVYSIQFRKIRKDGTVLWVQEFVRTVMEEGGSRSIFVVCHDVTELKEAELNFRLMAQAVASARDCISITDLENRIIFVNSSFQNTYGYTSEELWGKEISLLRPPGIPLPLLDQIQSLTRNGGWHGELLNRRKDGSDFPVELWTSTIRDESGSPVGFVGLARDISERKTTEEHLRQSEDQFRLIAENVADLIAVFDLDGKRLYNSPSYNSILGSPESLKGTNGFQNVHPEDRERVKAVFQEVVRSGIGQRIEYRFVRKDGSIRDFDSKGSVIRDSHGMISRLVVVSRDVTEEKRLASESLRAQRMESIGTLAGGIAHDLNNVLSPILMAIEVLRTKITDQHGRKILNTIEASAKRGSDIVRQVLAFGRGVQGERALVQLKHVVREVVKIACETFPKSIKIEADVPRDLWTVSADATQMHQVLLNVLVNARDAMPKGGTLTISAENVTLDEQYSRLHIEAKPGLYVAITVADTRTGIPADIRDKIFEPFFTTKDVGTGTGLGLSTTLAIVKSHGGFINLYSELGKGTTIRVYVPATGRSSHLAAVREESDLPAGNGELILVIDDESAIRDIAKETLMNYGYEVITASDGAEGLNAFADNRKRIKAVITDMMMPVMDGAAAILALKEMDPGVKIIAASGLAFEGQIAASLKSSVQTILTKPYSAETLLKALQTVLKPKQS